MTQIEGGASIIKYLTAMRQLRDTRPNNTYIGIEEFILTNGLAFSWKPKTAIMVGAPDTPKYCFENAYRLARLDRRLTYAEGYAMRIIPVHHAWCVDADGRVYDPTWRDNPQFDDDRAYFGVPFELPFVTASRRGRNTCSILENWEHDHPTLRRDFKYERPARLAHLWI